MADCGAAGSALDRASRLSSNAANSSKALDAISSFIGNVSHSTQNPLHSQIQGNEVSKAMIPAAPPNFIQSPTTSGSIFQVPQSKIQHVNQMDSVWEDAQTNSFIVGSHHPMPSMKQMPLPQIQSFPVEAKAMMQNQMQMQMQMQMQLQAQNQQMMLMNMQKQRILLQHQQKQQQSIQSQQSITTTEHKEGKVGSNTSKKMDKAWEEAETKNTYNNAPNTVTNDVNTQAQNNSDELENDEERAWYESVESEFRNELDRMKRSEGNEGLTEGATIEELAEAWENAQRESDWYVLYFFIVSMNASQIRLFLFPVYCVTMHVFDFLTR